MRMRDLQVGVEYATCDGMLVMPEDPLQRGWMEWVSAKGDEPEGHYEFHEADSIDPWGGCIDARRPPETGVRTRTYATDQDGNRIGDGKLVVTSLRDIKGTWTEFMVLHGQKVRERAIDRERNDTISRLIKEVRSEIGGNLPYNGSASVDLHYGLLETSGYGNVEYVEHVEFRFTVEPEDLPAFLKQLGAKVPRALVDELKARHLTDDEWAALQQTREANGRRSRRKVRR